MEQRAVQPGPLLSTINSPDDLKKLSPDELPQVCQELRNFIVDIVSVHGGHFGASLGVVELTTALHYAYETPEDQLIWDVGHQAYGHKILTGRRDIFHTNRKHDGLSGFPKRSESPYDAFGVGHSSTSISAALGMSVARDLKRDENQVVAVIGDGAMTAGLAFEGMNNAGVQNSDILVILNDNRMSIDPNVGALNEYLADITTTKTFNRMRDDLYDMLGYFKGAGEKMRKIASRMEAALTSALTPGSLFRSLGFKYYGPVDGHNVKNLVRQLNDLKKVGGPKLLHIVTVKGKGFAPAERDQVKWHASGSPFDKVTGHSLVHAPAATPAPKYQDVFADTLIELAEKDERLVGITAAMPSGTSMLKMMERFPDRAFDVGIAEQHAITFAGGLATRGVKPFVAIYSTFLQRGFDQVVHDVAIQKLPVVFCMDRAGVAGADGPTHHGLYDIAYLRCLPNMVVSAPMNERDLRNLMYTASRYEDGAFAIRYPRGSGTGISLEGEFELIRPGTGNILKEGSDILFMSYGTIGNYVPEAIRLLEKTGVSAGHYDMRFAKPLDTDLLDRASRSYDIVITIEDAAKYGGFGSAVAEYYMEQEKRPILKILGVPDDVIEHGTQLELHAEMGLDPKGLARQAIELLETRISTPRD
ncbi:1-deoxy-D-xylulose-5-phosphate synthase [Balneolales bacterium ANBcel1]|nr:1-deoxy-D-xylulose-5-phosphate synthase [Balneolales bacterium ANBcel1]